MNHRASLKEKQQRSTSKFQLIFSELDILYVFAAGGVNWYAGNMNFFNNILWEKSLNRI